MPSKTLYNGCCTLAVRKTTSALHPYAVVWTTDREHGFEHGCIVASNGREAMRLFHSISRLLLAPVEKLIV